MGLRIMFLKGWKILIILLFLLFPIAVADDSVAMRKLADALSPTPRGWSMNSSDYCTWQGVYCGSSNRVTEIDLASQNLSGNLPYELSTLSNLRSLDLNQNRLSGPFPSLANLSELYRVRIDANNFTSIRPDFFQGLTSLQVLNLSVNTNLDPWSLPTDLAQCSNLMYFEASAANLEGNIPDIFAYIPGLKGLILSFNNLTGILPASFANSRIFDLELNNQTIGLSGSINVLSSMRWLVTLLIHNNNFTGPIPDFTKCERLYELRLADNQLTGIVPPSLESQSNLKYISIANNKLQGPMPLFDNIVQLSNTSDNHFCLPTAGFPCDSQVSIMLEIAENFGYPIKLSDTWLGNDACKNWSFVTCNKDNQIVTLNLGKQNFTGTVSNSFGNLIALRTLYLNDNNLTGSIPDSLTQLTRLELLDVSNNNLSGKLPAFAASVQLITRPGNPLLEIDEGHRSKNASRLLVIIVSVIAVFLFVFFSYKIMKVYVKSNEVKDQEEGTPSQEQNKDNHQGLHFFRDGNVVISVEVLQQATDNFNENNILGKGGFGVVYKGELHNKTKIAVKRIEAKSMSIKEMSEFQAEIEVLTKVRHRHLVDLLGYCCKGNEGFLVYEYMPQGTLAQHLFEWSERGYLPIEWNQRVRIALDVAHGVEYLHSLAPQSFIHRDLKSSNILLGEDMRAKVGDFGLVKNLPNGKNSLETIVAGTFGYLAPEYTATGRVTTKVDVYAFGVILMEMITGRRALDNTRQEEGWMSMHLATWFTSILMKEKTIPKAIIDNTLKPKEDKLVSICKVAKLAVNCTNPEPCRRPDIGHAVSILSAFVQEWRL